MSSADRYARQRQLAEVGDKGQLCLESTIFCLDALAERSLQSGLQTSNGEAGESAFTREMAAIYGEAAGLQVKRGSFQTNGCLPSQLTLRRPAVPPTLQSAFRHSSAREIGHGAALALSCIIESLGLTPSPSHDD